jgi:hypothetical protein
MGHRGLGAGQKQFAYIMSEYTVSTFLAHFASLFPSIMAVKSIYAESRASPRYSEAFISIKAGSMRQRKNF